MSGITADSSGIPRTAAAATAASTPNFKKILMEGNGKPSATRVVTVVWGLGVFVVWAYLSVTTSQIINLPDHVMEILGIVLTGKVVQRFAESPQDNSP